MDSRRSALIVVDMQYYFIESQSSLMSLVDYLKPGMVAPYVKNVQEMVIPAIQELLHLFRSLKWPIFFTELLSYKADRSDLPWWAQRINQLAVETVGRYAYPQFGDASAAIVAALLPQEGEAIFQKTTAGALCSTDLYEHLRKHQITSVIVCGVNTDVCVGQTARELADYGLKVIMVEDACATLSPDAHRTTLETFGMVFGQTMTTKEVMREFSGAI